MNYCIYSGAPLDIGSQFCANYGNRIKLFQRCGSVLKGNSVYTWSQELCVNCKNQK